MGADLYIPSLYEPNHGRWQVEFDAAVKERNSLPEDSPKRQQAQERVEHCYEQMQNQGYFRDPYNNWDLLWQFGLSWWDDIIPMLDKGGRLPVAETIGLRALLSKREAIFEERVSALTAEDEQYFRSRYAALQQFLDQAIALGEPIDCSL